MEQDSEQQLQPSTSSIACTVLWAVAALDAQALLQQGGAGCARAAVLKLLELAGAAAEAAEAAMEAERGGHNGHSGCSSGDVVHLSASAGVQFYQFIIWVQDQALLQAQQESGGRWQVAGEAGDAGLLSCISPAALRWSARMWHQEVEESCSSQAGSARQQALAIALQRLAGPEVEVLPPGQLTEDGMLRVGHGVLVTAQQAAGRGAGPVMVAMELAGALQLLAPNMVPEGGLAAQHRALRARGWKVVVIIYHDWDDQQGEDEQVEYLKRKIREAVEDA
jgi:hypothetical protein